MLETSKGFAKRFLQRHNIPTANYAVCTSAAEVNKAIEMFHPPIVVKADGLAAGKGVIMCDTHHMAAEAARGLFSGALLGTPEHQIVIEEFLEGDEISFLCLSDGAHVAPLVPSQDHKRIGEGRHRPQHRRNGRLLHRFASRSRHVGVDSAPHRRAYRRSGMAEEDTPFMGVLYCGLMMTARGPQVLEFNARFGDPETQAILVRLESDLVEALEACIDGGLANSELRWTPGASACVVASSGGYPGSYKTGFPIKGLGAAAQVAGVQVFHAGTTLVGGQMLTAGGRVLGVTAAADSLEQALSRAYQAMAEISFEGIYYRRDIGHRALRAAK